MNKKKQASLARQNRIRTKQQEKAAKESRKRARLMLDLNMLEEQAREQDAADEAARNG